MQRKKQTNPLYFKLYVFTQTYIYIYTFYLHSPELGSNNDRTQPDQAEQRHGAALEEDEFEVEDGC